MVVTLNCPSIVFGNNQSSALSLLTFFEHYFILLKKYKDQHIPFPLFNTESLIFKIENIFLSSRDF